ncbi:unnamed protein product [marine sediment metagenome]|uniref:Uncharacterized protein n=1 Tax=marine sediment metagenome TaxID=412755 RepID=X1FDJ0_9ZZZZ
MPSIMVYAMTNQRINAKITPELKEQLIEIQNKTGSTLTEVIENTIENGLNHTGLPKEKRELENSDYSLNDLVSEVAEIKKRGYEEGVADTINKIKNNPNKLDFVGGNEQKPKEKDDEKEKDEYECPCGAIHDTPVKFCGECGEEMDWGDDDDDDDEEKGWLSSLINWNNSNSNRTKTYQRTQVPMSIPINVLYLKISCIESMRK